MGACYYHPGWHLLSCLSMPVLAPSVKLEKNFKSFISNHVLKLRLQMFFFFLNLMIWGSQTSKRSIQLLNNLPFSRR